MFFSFHLLFGVAIEMEGCPLLPFSWRVVALDQFDITPWESQLISPVHTTRFQGWSKKPPEAAHTSSSEVVCCSIFWEGGTVVTRWGTPFVLCRFFPESFVIRGRILKREEGRPKMGVCKHLVLSLHAVLIWVNLDVILRFYSAWSGLDTEFLWFLSGTPGKSREKFSNAPGCSEENSIGGWFRAWSFWNFAISPKNVLLHTSLDLHTPKDHFTVLVQMSPFGHLGVVSNIIVVFKRCKGWPWPQQLHRRRAVVSKVPWWIWGPVEWRKGHQTTICQIC